MQDFLSHKKKFLLKIEYNGAFFHGWQIQPNGLTVQEKIQHAFLTYLNQPVFVDAASRTDAGVHAEGQLATVVFCYDNVEQLFRSINALIYPHIAIINYKELPADFLIRKHTTAKEYCYNCYTGSYKVFYNQRAWWIKKPINCDQLKKLVSQFIGTHDFQAFRADGCSSPTTIKTITDLDFRCDETDRNQLINFRIKGNGFLRHMIRIMIGTLIQIAEGKLDEKTIDDAFRSGARKKSWCNSTGKGAHFKKHLA